MVVSQYPEASFLSEPKSRSRLGAQTYFTEDDPIPHFNGPILTIAQIIQFVMALAVEAQLLALFITASEMVPLRNTLMERFLPPFFF